jgi:hypothetical protein
MKWGDIIKSRLQATLSKCENENKKDDKEDTTYGEKGRERHDECFVCVRNM